MMSRKSIKNGGDEKSLRIILKTRLFFGLYYKLSTSYIFCAVIKLLCILIGVSHVVIYYAYSRELETTEVYSIFELVETAVRVLISLLTGEEYLMKFSRKLHTDLRRTFKVTFKNHATNLMMLIGLLGEMIAIFAMGLDVSNLAEYFVFGCRFMVCFTSRFTTIYLSDSYRFSIRILRKSLVEKLKNKNVTVSEKIMHVEGFLSHYMNLVNNFRTTLTVTRITIIFGFVCDIVRVDLLVNELINNKSVSWEFIPRCKDTLTFLLALCLPALLIELATNDLDEIKKVLAEQLLVHNDKKLRGIIYDAIDYIACTSTCTLWNEFPMRINLVLSFLNLCISYIIVLLQFTY